MVQSLKTFSLPKLEERVRHKSTSTSANGNGTSPTAAPQLPQGLLFPAPVTNSPGSLPGIANTSSTFVNPNGVTTTSTNQGEISSPSLPSGPNNAPTANSITAIPLRLNRQHLSTMVHIAKFVHTGK